MSEQDWWMRAARTRIDGCEQPERDLRTQNIIQWLSLSMAVDLALYCAFGPTSSPFLIRTPLRYLLRVVPCISAYRLMYGTRLRTSRHRGKCLPALPSISVSAKRSDRAWGDCQDPPQCSTCHPHDHAKHGLRGYAGSAGLCVAGALSCPEEEPMKGLTPSAQALNHQEGQWSPPNSPRE